MADSVAPITVGPDWEDVYSLTGIPVGTPLLVTAAGATAQLTTKETKPTNEVGGVVETDQTVFVSGSEAGLWASASGTSATLYVQEATGGIHAFPFSDPRTIDGSKAYTMQPYTALNIKRGSQFYARVAYPIGSTVAAGATVKLYFETGDKTILVKDRMFHYIGEEFEINIYSSPTGVTGGTAIPISNWNLKSPQSTTVVSALKGVATTSDGTAVQGPEYFFGAAATGQRTPDAIPEGYERVIPPNSNFLVTITNNGANPARCEYFLTWHEGDISTEIP